MNITNLESMNNSLQMTAQTYFSHKQLLNKSSKNILDSGDLLPNNQHIIGFQILHQF